MLLSLRQPGRQREGGQAGYVQQERVRQQGQRVGLRFHCRRLGSLLGVTGPLAGLPPAVPAAAPASQLRRWAGRDCAPPRPVTTPRRTGETAQADAPAAGAAAKALKQLHLDQNACALLKVVYAPGQQDCSVSGGVEGHPPRQRSASPVILRQRGGCTPCGACSSRLRSPPIWLRSTRGNGGGRGWGGGHRLSLLPWSPPIANQHKRKRPVNKEAGDGGLGERCRGWCAARGKERNLRLPCSQLVIPSQWGARQHACLCSVRDLQTSRGKAPQSLPPCHHACLAPSERQPHGQWTAPAAKPWPLHRTKPWASTLPGCYAGCS